MSVMKALALASAALLLIAVPLAAQEEGAGIPPGTVINMHNWRQYKQFMPYGMRQLFKGTYYFRFPADFEIQIGPTHHYQPPKIYLENTRKYADQVKIKELPDGERTLVGYVAGQPFPNPQGSLKGWEMLLDLWYTSFPHIMCSPDNYIYFVDHFNNHSKESFIEVYRKLNHISDVGQPVTDPNSHGVDYTEYLQIQSPEQARYTAQLAIYYDELQKPEQVFLFVPALRRTLRLSTAARCSPVVGSDYTQDDARNTLVNGSPSRFDAAYLRDQQIIGLTSSPSAAVWADPANYYQPIFFPKPVVGKWEVRNTHVIDVRRIPSQRNGYCYGKKIVYLDAEVYMSLWLDIYDTNMKLWKIGTVAFFPEPAPGEGIVPVSGNISSDMIDLAASHLSHYMAAGPDGKAERANQDCENFDGMNLADYQRYATVSGLSELMR